jgi:hypothetical protein
VHARLVEGLRERVLAWSPAQTLADIISSHASRAPLYLAFARNLPSALAAIDACMARSDSLNALLLAGASSPRVSVPGVGKPAA